MSWLPGAGIDDLLQGRPSDLLVDPATYPPPQDGEGLQEAIRWLRGEATTPPVNQHGCGAYAACTDDGLHCANLRQRSQMPRQRVRRLCYRAMPEGLSLTGFAVKRVKTLSAALSKAATPTADLPEHSREGSRSELWNRLTGLDGRYRWCSDQ